MPTLASTSARWNARHWGDSQGPCTGFHLIMPMEASLKRDACLIGDTVIAVFLLILLTWNA